MTHTEFDDYNTNVDGDSHTSNDKILSEALDPIMDTIMI